MISIVYESGDIHGTCTYRVQLDTQLICKFECDNLEGLARCLHQAADAVELSEWAEVVIIDEIKGG